MVNSELPISKPSVLNDTFLDGGTHMILRLNNQTTCESKAIYGKPTGHAGMMGMGGGANGQAANATKGVGGGDNYEGIVKMTTCDKPTKVSKGDTFTVEAAFDLEKHPQ
jgi:hypothetical protein